MQGKAHVCSQKAVTFRTRSKANAPIPCSKSLHPEMLAIVGEAKDGGVRHPGIRKHYP